LLVVDIGRSEVIVIGGGQAGLAIGYYLAEQGRRFMILEAAREPAAAWRARWDSLRLFTPVRYDSLPGLAFPGEPDSYPGRDDVVAYLTEYARRFELPVELNSRVHSVRARDGGFLVELADRTYEAEQVVVATGPFQVPFTPAIAGGLGGDGFRLDHSLVQLPVVDEDGQVAHERGVTEVPGLYFLGLPWQHTRGSALLGWVKDDAQHLAQQIGAFAQSQVLARAR
jgi:glycine/D-amino acid oxidase-like deaminating enzyme